MTRSSARLEGLLGAALAANHSGRLSRFITDESSPAIALFAPAQVAKNREGDWYGEHAGKWLYAASKAAARADDTKLTAKVRRVADYLVSVQQSDGYLGTYAPERRFTHPQPPPQRTWDGAPGQRSWDIWTHSYVVLGLLEVHRNFPDLRYRNAACRIGDLCWATLTEGGVDITHLGNHHGMSATVFLDAAVELHFATGEHRYLDLAKLILEQAERRPELNLITRALGGADASEIGTGKAYQLIWNLVGLAKLHRATGEPRYLQAATNVWENIRNHHLTRGGGPWGGVAHRSREVFNPAGVFSPYGYVETCSILAWVQLNRELLAITREARYAEEIERTAYNDLIGAQAPNGEDWNYYSFPNGARVFTTYWRCCKSSGAMAIEELPAIAYDAKDGEIRVDLYGPGESTFELPAVGIVDLKQVTEYPFGGDIRIRVTPASGARFKIHARIPAWASGANVQINGADVEQPVEPGTYVALDRAWEAGDEIALHFPMPAVLHHQTSRNIQQSVAPGGAPVEQQVMRRDYLAITRGPLVYATGLIDGFKTEETLRLATEPTLEMTHAPGYEGPAIRLNLDYRAPLTFHPYYEAGQRKDGTWRLTWMQVVP